MLVRLVLVFIATSICLSSLSASVGNGRHGVVDRSIETARDFQKGSLTTVTEAVSETRSTGVGRTIDSSEGRSENLVSDRQARATSVTLYKVNSQLMEQIGPRFRLVSRSRLTERSESLSA